MFLLLMCFERNATAFCCLQEILPNKTAPLLLNCAFAEEEVDKVQKLVFIFISLHALKANSSICNTCLLRWNSILPTPCIRRATLSGSGWLVINIVLHWPAFPQLLKVFTRCLPCAKHKVYALHIQAVTHLPPPLCSDSSVRHFKLLQ